MRHYNVQSKDYQAMIERKKRDYGSKFSDTQLSKQFIPYYNNQKRIEVEFESGEIKRGRVGVTTGWVPVFLLVLTTRSLGSSWTLSDKDKIKNVIS